MRIVEAIMCIIETIMRIVETIMRIREETNYNIGVVLCSILMAS